MALRGWLTDVFVAIASRFGYGSDMLQGYVLGVLGQPVGFVVEPPAFNPIAILFVALAALATRRTLDAKEAERGSACRPTETADLDMPSKTKSLYVSPSSLAWICSYMRRSEGVRARHAIDVVAITGRRWRLAAIFIGPSR
jgi:hypothetical protein